MKITLLGYDEDTGLVMYNFENKDGEDVERGVNPILKEDGAVDTDATMTRAEEVGRGIEVKMQIKRREKRKKKTATEHGMKRFKRKVEPVEEVKEPKKRKTRKKTTKAK